MARNKNVTHLQNVAIFSTCTTRELSQIERAADEEQVEAGNAIVSEGEEGRKFYLILQGEATVSRDGKKLTKLGPGQYFGELALLDRAPRNATVTAATPMTLLVLGDREFSAVLDQWPGVAHKLLMQMAARLRAADDRAVTH
ncbi:MAG TPA: cyclic nucleotide-binding domain-containing protein [Acidimicrobiales bacterium]|nr:cyclic nucleotide-binding domain-containing protein [Acidimicrobiales bacterium]